MWYELFLRRDEPLARSVLVEALPKGAQVSETEGGLELTLSSGTIRLAWHPPRPPGSDDGIAGLDLLVPGGANPALAEAACDVAFGLSKDCGFRVYDPQLGRVMESRDSEAIQTRMARFASYLTETVGLDEAASARHISVDVPRPRMPARTRFYLILAGGLLLLAVLARYC